MNKAKEDLLLHPVRVRIIIAVAGREMTAQQLANELPDVPQATLYRHINTLAAAGILSVVGERRVRNTSEKTYALPDQGSMLTVEDLQSARPEDYIRLFTQYLGVQLGYFTRYIEKGDVDLARDNVLFQMSPVYLSEAEVQKLGQAINAALLPYMQNGPSPERRRSILGLTFLPDIVGAASSADDQAADAPAKSSDTDKE